MRTRGLGQMTFPTVPRAAPAPSVSVGDGEQPIPWDDTGSGTVEVVPVPPKRTITVRSPDGREAEQEVSEETWRRVEAMRRAGFSQISPTNRRAVRRAKALARQTGIGTS